MEPSTTPVELVGRSSSHFTRIARIAALELGVAHAFRPVFELASLDAAAYAGNPALKIPILVDEHGPLFGTENICRELARRAGRPPGFVLRGDVGARVVANAEELVLHAMAAEVAIVMARASGDASLAASPKHARSLDGCLTYLDTHLDAVLAALPRERTTSFVEIALFCAVTHLPWREVLDVTPWTRLAELCARFGERASARATPYVFDRW